MKITRRSPRIKIGNTTYTFGKNGVSRSTKIAKGVRVRTNANGKQSIGGSFLCWRWSQDLDEVGKNKTSEEIKQIREQRKNELSLSLLLTHPIVFFDHLFRKSESQSQTKKLNQKNQNKIPDTDSKTFPQNQNYQNEKDSSFQVEIFKDYGGNIKKVTDGKLTLKNDRILILANIEKEIFYRDISDVFCDKGKIFISSKGRNIPLIVGTENATELMRKIVEKMGNK